MKTVIAHLKSVSAYSQSRVKEPEDVQGEGGEDRALRTWREHLHADENGIVFIPPADMSASIAYA